jgi:glutaconyl-CoA/methylmalonyl-CoA decarboxylase subunit gamma
MADEIVEAPAPGKILRIHAEAGKPIAKGDRILIMEALKMELPIVAPVGGTLQTLNVSAGQAVEAGDTLAVIVS